jgi:hypothetical protein
MNFVAINLALKIRGILNSTLCRFLYKFIYPVFEE